MICHHCDFPYCLECRPPLFEKEDYYGHRLEVDHENRLCCKCEK